MSSAASSVTGSSFAAGGRNTPRNATGGAMDPQAVLAAFQRRGGKPRTSNDGSSAASSVNGRWQQQSQRQQTTLRPQDLAKGRARSQASTPSVVSSSVLSYSNQGDRTPRGISGAGRRASSQSGSRSARSPGRHITMRETSPSARSERSSRSGSRHSSVARSSTPSRGRGQNVPRVMPGHLHRAVEAAAKRNQIGTLEGEVYFTQDFEERFDGAAGRPTWTSPTRCKAPVHALDDLNESPPSRSGVKPWSDHPLAQSHVHELFGPSTQLDHDEHVSKTLAFKAQYEAESFAGKSSWVEKEDRRKSKKMIPSNFDKTQIDEVVFGHKLCATTKKVLERDLQKIQQARKGCAGGVPANKDTKTVFGMLNQSNLEHGQYRTAKRQVQSYAESDASHTHDRRGRKPMPGALGRRSAVAHTAFGAGGRTAVDPHIAWNDLHERHLADDGERPAGVTSGHTGIKMLKQTFDIDALTRPRIGASSIQLGDTGGLSLHHSFAPSGRSTPRASSAHGDRRADTSRKERPRSAPPGSRRNMVRSSSSTRS